MNKFSIFFKKIGKWIALNKAKSIVIGSTAAITIAGTTTAVVLITRHDHTPMTAIFENYIPPTCVNSGTYDEVIYCEDCDEELERKTVTVDAVGHNAVTDEAIMPTCTEAGLTEGKHCSVCNTTFVAQAVIDALGHDEVNHSAKAPTCTEVGWDAYVTCSRCEYTTYTEKSATGHSHTEIVTDPTCTTKGYTTHTCHCGDSYVGTYTNALNHNYVNHSAQNPTCTDIGWDAYQTCTRCDYTTYNKKPATGHSHSAAVTNPTCTEKGYTTHTCHCGDTYVDSYVEELGHTEVVDAQINPTCTESGLTKGKHCLVCDEILQPQFEIDPLGHTDVKDNAIAPTCTEAGLTEGKHCSVCNAVLVAQKIVPANGHTEVIDEAVDATCSTPGYSEGKHCSVCNEILVKPNPVNPVPHANFDVLTQNKFDATCTMDGSYDKVTVCNSCLTEIGRETLVIEAIGHTEVIDEAVAPTCTATGLTEGAHCSVCDEILVAQTVVNALGHTDSTPVQENYTVPTCYVLGGYDTVTYCSVCGEATKTEHTEIEKLEHVFENYTYDTGSAKCGVDGTKTAYCSNNCGTANTISDPGTAFDHVMPEDPVCGAVWSCTLCNLPVEEYPHDYTRATCMTLAICNTCGQTTGGFADHTPGDPIEEDRVEPNCTNAGSYNAVVYCKIEGCGHKISSTPIEIPAQHNYVNGNCIFCNITDFSYFSFTLLANGTYEISPKETENMPSIVNIPEEYNGIAVTSIGWYAFYNCSSLTSITIPDSLTSIGNYAFYNCSSLTIYCEAVSKPSGWSSDWNRSNRPVVWDCNNNKVAGAD